MVKVSLNRNWLEYYALHNCCDLLLSADWLFLYQELSLCCYNYCIDNSGLISRTELSPAWIRLRQHNSTNKEIHRDRMGGEILIGIIIVVIIIGDGALSTGTGDFLTFIRDSVTVWHGVVSVGTAAINWILLSSAHCLGWLRLVISRKYF